MNDSRLTRRSLVRGTAAGIAGMAAIAGTRGAFASGSASVHQFTPGLRQALSGEITVSYPDEAGKKPKYVDQAAANVTTANPDAKINVDLQKVDGGTFMTSLLLALDGGDAPDVFHVGGDQIGALAEAGYIEPLDPFLANWPDWEAQYPESVRGGVSFQGQTWAIPYGLDTRFLYYRKDAFDTAGLGADWQPANVAGILEAAQAIQTADAAQIPYALYAGTGAQGGAVDHAYIPLVWAYGGDVQDADGKWIADSPAIRKALTYIQDAYVTDKLVPGEILTTTQPWKAMREKLGTGDLAMLFEGGWVYGGWYSADATNAETNIGYLLHPTETGGPSFTIGGPGTCWYISATSKNKDLAWEFIKAFNQPDIVAALNLEDPHPVARADAAALPEFQAVPFLVDSTKSLESARFVGSAADRAKFDQAVQEATGRVAAGEASPDEAAQRMAEDLARSAGDDRVVVQQ
jgi:multiple sugar transport system substrate-binding protein